METTALRTLTRIAMWSGPRNVSTALMRSWGTRPDTIVCDEPLYAHYLAHTGRDHPGGPEVTASHETDWRRVVDYLTGPVPETCRVFYQKHMAHHLLPHIERGWIESLTNCFLLRDPREMLPSLDRIFAHPTLEDTGLPQQAEIFEDVRRRTGVTPPVVDARTLLESPEGVLRALCDALELPFSASMLSWPPGPRATDGVWAKHWYGSVERTTGFEPYRPKTEPLPAHLEGLLAECNEYYQLLYAHRLRA